MEFANKKAIVELSPESKSAGLLFPQKNGKTGPDYLKGVLDYVSKENRHKIFGFKKPAGATLKIGPLEDTIYSEQLKTNWEQVRNRPTGRRLEQEHLKLVTKNKATFMENLKATAAIKGKYLFLCFRAKMKFMHLVSLSCFFCIE
ncbi:Protein FAM3C [Dissostichus eleginoides]|uniref:Protein FAM3C n=1 Tax=Dissostichus eleginoides TaxID=100907 RepID=A0AAD9EW32_DISEL|nr:Protein FAM3C [Dissostichus eleginoides]